MSLKRLDYPLPNFLKGEQEFLFCLRKIAFSVSQVRVVEIPTKLDVQLVERFKILDNAMKPFQVIDDRPPMSLADLG
jgi:hypothetical protein